MLQLVVVIVTYLFSFVFSCSAHVVLVLDVSHRTLFVRWLCPVECELSLLLLLLLLVLLLVVSLLLSSVWFVVWLVQDEKMSN